MNQDATAWCPDGCVLESRLGRPKQALGLEEGIMRDLPVTAPDLNGQCLQLGRTSLCVGDFSGLDGILSCRIRNEILGKEGLLTLLLTQCGLKGGLSLTQLKRDGALHVLDLLEP